MTTLKQKETAVIYVAQNGREIVGCKDEKLAVKYFIERYGHLPNHVLQCPYYVTDHLMLNGKKE